MDSLSGYFWTLSLLCCIFWISSAEERHTLSKVVGSTVTMRCHNEPLNTPTQVTWKWNGKALLSFEPQTPIYQHPEALRLKINMSVSENEQYTLAIESVQMEHEGNYTCETSFLSGLWIEKWELIITENVDEEAEDVENLWTVVPVVICVCNLLVFVTSWTILHLLYKRFAGNNIPSPTAEMQTEVIYEPCLDGCYSANVHDWSLSSVCRYTWKPGQSSI